MTKEQKISQLGDFSNLIGDWLKVNNSGMQYQEEEIRYKELTKNLMEQWGVIEEIFRSLGLPYEGQLDRQRMKGLTPKNGNLFIDGFIGENHYSVQYTNLEKIQALCLSAKGKIENDLFLPQLVLQNTNSLLNILQRFPAVVSRWQSKNLFEINSEKIIQDLLYTMLIGSFPTLKYENPNSKAGITSSIADFTIDEIQLFLEVKYVSKKEDAKRIEKECKSDIISYAKQPNCNTIIFFVYDPNKNIDNKDNFSKGLGDKFSDGEKSCTIHTLIIN